MKKVIYTLLISIISLSCAFAQSRVLDTNAEVGSLPGGIAVSPSGAATYNIPLAIPEGRAGMTPSISINYNSQSGNGLLGVGWSIGGLSAISRGGNTIYHDGQVEGIKFTSDDGFFLDGQRLLSINDSDLEFTTEAESFSKIIALGEAGNGPEHFKVWTKDGRIIEYGNTSSSRIEASGKSEILTWHVNSIEDKLGNYIEFNYIESFGMGLISQIKYAGNSRTNDDSDYTVNFIYPLFDLRTDPIKKHIDGSTIEMHNLLDKIIISRNLGEIINTYKITYSDDFYSHIENIKLYAGDETAQYFNETIFDWGDINHDVGEEIISETVPDVEEYFLDINGDGLTDIIKAFWVNEDNQKVYYNWNYKLRNSNGQSFLPPVNFDQDINPKQLYLLSGDFNGDGLFDFAEVSLKDIYAPEKIENVSIERVFYSTGSTFDIKYISYINYEYENIVSYFTGDFDGDAITDFLIVEKNKTTSNTHIWKHILSKDFARELSVTIDFGNTDISDAGVYLGDFNGNGKTDILRTAKYGGNPHTSNSFIYEFDFQNNQTDVIWGSVSNGYPNIWYRIYTGDFNNDGITDILTYNYYSAGGWKASCFNGKDEWEEFGLLPIINFDPEDDIDQKYHGIALSDFNGDGTTDIIELEKDNYEDNFANYHIYYSNGSEFLVDNTPTGVMYCIGGLNFNGGSGILKHYNSHFGNDFNGDGKSDLYKENGYYNDRVFLFGYLNTNDKIYGFTNGLGNNTTVSYNTLTNNFIYTKGSGSLYPLTDIQVAIYVVDSIIPDPGLGTGLETTYHYSGARIHKLGKGFLGFQQVIATSNSSNTISETNYGLLKETLENKELYLMPFPDTVKIYSMNNGVLDKLLSETFVEMGLIRTQSNDLIYLPVTTSSISHSWDNDTENTFVKTTKTEQPLDKIDEYGNSLKSYAGVDNQLYDESVPATDYKYVTTVQNTYTNNIDLDNWLISRPDWTMIIKHDDDNGTNDKKMKSEFEYYNQTSDAGFSLPKKVITIPMPNLQGEEDYYNSFTRVNEYEYDYYGHLTKKTTSAPLADTPLDQIITEYKYDVSDEFNTGYGHRFLTRIITPSPGDDYVEQFVYNVITGLVEKEISPNGMITEYEYGSFERLKKTNYPDGNFVDNNMIWTGQTNGQLYYSETKNNSGAIAKTYYDKFGRELKKTVPHYWTQKHSFTEYDEMGRIERVSTPWIKQDGELQWTYFEYDTIGRVIKTTLPTENLITTEYKGATTYTTNSYTGIRTYEKLDALRRPIEVYDPTGFVKYYYFSDGNSKEVEAGGISTTMKYDPIGNQIELNEPNAGVNTYVYDAFGMLTDQTDGKGNHYKMEYDILGRVTKRSLESGGNETTNYEYIDNKNDNGFGKLSQTDLNSIVYTYGYDPLGRTVSETQSFQGNNYTSEFTYDENGNIDTYTYPGGLELEYEYYSDGSLDLVKNNKNQEILWKVNTLNDEGGQITSMTLGNGLSTSKLYDDFGFLTGIITGSIQDLEYNWNANTGNLNWRRDNVFGLKEAFTYDMLLQARLESWEVIGLEKYEANYNHNGNISKKSDVVFMGEGWMTYYQTPAGPHALTSISNPKDDYLEHAEKQSIEYTPFNKTQRIDQFKIDESSRIGGYDYTYGIEYGPDRARKISVLYKDYQLSKMKHYVGNYEVEFDAEGNTRELNYISGGDGLFAVYVNNMGADTMYYTYKDHLGSPYCVTREDGEIIVLNGREAQIYSFDPWGRRRHPQRWDFVNVPTTHLFDRGFTGHEHLDAFDLINMNGRTYDPWLGRMLQPDNYVQAAGYLQNYNRYSYAANNPLKYTDPDGEVFGLLSFGLMFVGDATSNLVNGVSDPFGTAWNNANTTFYGMNSALQLPIYTSDNTNISAGLSPFALGVSVNASYTNGNLTYSGSGGFGFGGWFVGGGVTYHSGDLVMGISVGGGKNHWGIGASAIYKGYGGGYTYTNYGDAIGPDGLSNSQNVGGISLYFGEYQFRMENDFFAFEHQDRWRSNAVEFSWGHGKYTIGTHLYNNDPKNVDGEYEYKVDLNIKSPIWQKNKHGMGGWINGLTYSSPIYFGFKYGNTIDRIGYSHYIFQDATQNGIHKYFPLGYQNYYANYEKFNYGMYYYSGWHSNYSIWGR